MIKTLPKKYLSVAGTVFGFGLLVFFLWLFSRTLSHYDKDEVVASLRAIPFPRIILAVGCSLLSYGVQSSYDYFGAIGIGLNIRPYRAMMAAFVGNAFTNNIGLSLFTGVGLRLRYYLAWGIPVLDTAKVIFLSKLAFLNGLFLLVGLSEILHPVVLPNSISFPLSPRILGWILILPPLGMILWNGFGKTPEFQIGKVLVRKPGQVKFLLQILMSMVHFALGAMTLYFLLPATALRAAGYEGPAYFLGAFMAVKIVVLFFPVPGSLGIWEGTAMAVLTPALPAYSLLGALLAYRCIYYFLPFLLAVLVSIGFESLSGQGLLASILKREKKGQHAMTAGGDQDSKSQSK